MGQVLARAGLARRDRLLRQGRPHAVPRAARLQHRRLRLHDLHRELRPAAGVDLGGGRGGRPRRLLGALGQPQLRGAHPPGGEGELPRLAAARGRLRARRPDGRRPRERAARPGLGRRGRLPARPLADERGDRPGGRRGGRRRHVPQAVRRRLHRRRALAGAADPRGQPLRLERRLDVHPPAAVLRGHAARARAAAGRRGRALPRLARRQRHHRPHLARRLDQAREPGRRVADRARRRAALLQLLRRAARQPRDHGARHLRQRAAEEPARPGQRGHVDGARPERRGDDDLRRRRALPRRGHAADRARRQGVRLRLVTRLGREGPEPARRARRDRRELRADPPLEPAHVRDRARSSSWTARTSRRSA